MKTVIAAALAALAFAPAVFAADRCVASASAPFKAGSATYTVEAFSDGPTCEKAVSALVIRQADSVVVWQEAMVNEFVMDLAGKANAKELGEALKEWVSGGSNIATTADLPEWKAGTDQPGAGAEFPFYQEEGMDQASYEEARKAKLPVFCYVQGMESLACIVVDPAGGAYKIGAQSFPG